MTVATTVQHPIATAAMNGGTAVPISSGTVSLDEGWAPYGQGEIVIPYDDPTNAAAVDPRKNDRALISASVAGHWEPAYTAWTEQRRNVCTNPLGSAATAATGYGAVNGSTVAFDAATKGVRVSCVANGTTDSGVAIASTINYTGAGPVTISLDVTGEVADNWRISFQGAWGLSYSPYTAVGVGQTKRLTWTHQAVGTVRGAVYLLRNNGAIASRVVIKNVLAREAGTFFDGATVPADATHERYRWVGAANGSDSVYETREDMPPVWQPDAGRTFDLGIRRRTVEFPGTATLTLATDEALLQDYAVLTDDTTPRASESSLRAVCNYVLNKVIPGKSLNATPSNDANVTAYWRVTNLVPNPSFEVDMTGWAAGTNAVNVGRTQNGGGVTPISGGWMAWWGAAAAGISFLSNTPTGAMSVTAGRTYVHSAYIVATAAAPAYLMIRWWDVSGQIIYDEYNTPVTTGTIPSGWKRLTQITTAPIGAVRVTLNIRWDAPASGHTVFNDAVMFYEGNEVVPYFDGSTPASSTYTYSWSNTPGLSQSTRTPVVDRSPELLTWKAGQDAWTFLEALVTQSGLRLFCDEKRVWRLVPTSYALPGYVSLSPPISTEGADIIDRGETPDETTWAQGVVCRYAWNDPQLGPQLRTDAAGSPGKVLVIDYARPFPGPGAAAVILKQVQGRGRVQNVTGRTDYAASPGMESRVVLPASPLVVGRVSSVEFGLSDGLMAVRSKGQTVIPPNAWSAVDPAVKWNTVPAGTTWQNYAPPAAAVELEGVPDD